MHSFLIDNFMNALTLAGDTESKISSCKFAKESVLYSKDRSNAVSVMWGLSRG